MKIILRIFLGLAAIIVILLLVALFVKKEYNVKRQVVINKPKEEVFNYMKMIRNQEKYSVWVMKDPNVRIVYTGTDGTPGFTSSWQSDNDDVGVGEQEIKSIRENESMEVEVRFKKPFEGTGWGRNDLTTEANGQTKVVTSFYGKSKYPMNIMNIFMNKMLGKDMQQNLDNMKNNIEKEL